MPKTAIEQWTIEAINAVLPDGTPEQQQRLACVIIQARAKEARTLATELTMKNQGNPAVQAIALHLIDREHKLEAIGLKWAECWPPAESKVEAEDSRIVRVM